MDKKNLLAFVFLLCWAFPWVPAFGQTAASASGPTDNFRLRQVVSSGATVGQQGTTLLMATLGQPVIGSQTDVGVLLKQGFWPGSGPVSCCSNRVGDANGNDGDEPQISDVAIMIDFLFIDRTPLWCYAEADANQSGGANPSADDITIGDITYLIDYLFMAGASLGLADCP
jgi:hypothetical protein